MMWNISCAMVVVEHSTNNPKIVASKENGTTLWAVPWWFSVRIPNSQSQD